MAFRYGYIYSIEFLKPVIITLSLQHSITEIKSKVYMNITHRYNVDGGIE